MKNVAAFILLILFGSRSLVAESGITVDLKTTTLATATGSNYQWYREGNALAGGAGQTLSVRKSGMWESD